MCKNCAVKAPCAGFAHGRINHSLDTRHSPLDTLDKLMSIWHKKRTFPGLLGLVLLFSLGLWVYYELMNAYVVRKDEQLRRALTVSETVRQLLIHAHPSPGKDNADILGRLSNIVERTELEHLRVEENARPWLTVCAEPSGCPRPTGHSGNSIGKRYIVVWRRIPIGAGSAPEEPASVHRLVMIMETRSPLGLIHTETRLVLAVLAMGFAGIAVMGLAWSASLRNRGLRERLKTAHDRRDRIEELSLAAAGLAHETKNPLGIIRGMAQQIAGGEGNPPDARRMAREIMEEADITTARLGDFLSYAKTREPSPVELDARNYVGRIEAMMSDDFRTRKVAFVSEVDDLTILADPDMLSQVLLNLLTNSLSFTESGGTVTVTLRAKGRDRAELRVADDGKGIPAALLPKVFKPYVSKRPDGCGIGLAIVKRIVEQSGWEIAVESEVGKGTRFAITRIGRVVGGSNTLIA